MFEQASKMALRFETNLGMLSTEDLWALPLTSATKVSLDAIAVELHRKISTDNLSFVDTPAVADATNQLRFEIVKHIIDCKKAEAAARAMERSNADKKQAILALIAKKEGEALESNSLEDLRALAQSLS